MISNNEFWNELQLNIFQSNIINVCLFTMPLAITYYSNDLTDLQSTDIYIAEVSYESSNRIWINRQEYCPGLITLENWLYVDLTEEYQFSAFVNNYYSFITMQANGDYLIRSGTFNDNQTITK